MKWITAGDLERWSGKVGASSTFPALVADLIRATARSIDAFRFPSGDKGQVPGFDGNLEAEAAPPFVPGGHSIWEFGVGGNLMAKADEDYEKSTSSIRRSSRKDNIRVCFDTNMDPKQTYA